MFDFYRMLGREHNQDMIRETQHYKLVREIKAKHTNNKAISPLRVILVAVINLVIKSF